MPAFSLLRPPIWISASVAVLTGLIAPAALAQQVLEGLPPPPTLPPADQYSVPGSPAAPVIMPQAQPQAQPQGQPAVRPQPQSRPTNRSQNPTQKFVVVYGDSPLLLSQVQQLVPGATVSEYRGQRLIQVGRFADRAEARRQMALLRSRGIQAEILEVPPGQWNAATAPREAALPPADTPTADLLPAAPVSREMVFGQTPSAGRPSPVETAAEARALQERDGRAYFIVVPGNMEELPAIRNQIVRLGDGFAIASRLEARDDPRGPHLRIGPFANRAAAERWNRYFQDFGIDARVYFRR